MILFKKRFLTLAEVHYGLDPGLGYARGDYPGIDAITFMQSPVGVPGATRAESNTLVVDLSQELETLRSALSKNTRYEINRATEKDAFAYRFWPKPDSETTRAFCGFFSDFAAKKGITATTRYKLDIYARAGALILSEVLSGDGVTLTWHAYFVAKGRARLIHSASRRLSDDKEFRRLVGRANRYHHWQDFARLKCEGVAVFDWGGISLKNDGSEQARITEFKKEFGGVLETTFNCELPLSARGRAYYLLRGQYYRWKSRVG